MQHFNKRGLTLKRITRISLRRRALLPWLLIACPLALTSPVFSSAVAIDKANINAHATILILGDSISAGYGIPEGKGWVSLLQKQLQELDKPILVINDSISGDTTSGGLARLPKALQDTRPNWVLIALGGNDGLRGQALQTIEMNLTQMISLSRKLGAKPLLLGIKLPPNYGKQYTQQFEQVFKRVSVSTNTPLLPFFLEGVGGHAELMQDDGIHPNSKAQNIIKNNVWQFIAPLINF